MKLEKKILLLDRVSLTVVPVIYAVALAIFFLNYWS